MEKIFPYGETSGDFVDADVANGVRGSKVPAQFFNKIQAEIIAAIEAAGLTPDGSNLEQLSEAIQTIASSGSTDLSGYATIQYVNDAIESAPSLGVDQEWHDMKDSRSVGITYTNLSGRPIMVSVSTNYSSASGLGLIVDENYLAFSGGIHALITSVIPDQSTYRFEVNATTILYWFELR